MDVGQPAAERRPERGPRRRSAALATARRAVTRFQDDDLGDRAAALTYYAMLSLFPGLIVLVALLGLLGQYPRTTNALLDIVGELAPSSTVASLRGPIEGIVRNKGGAGALLGVGLTASMWSASGYVGALTRALNAIQHLDERRPFWKRRPLQLVITVAMVIALALSAVALVLTGPLAHAVGRRVGLGDAAVTAWGIGKWPLLVLLALVVVGALYRLVPDRSGGRPRWITPGGGLAVLTWVVASLALTLYVRTLGSYSATYGTLGAAVVLLVWLWLTNLALLFGAELNDELGRRDEPD